MNETKIQISVNGKTETCPAGSSLRAYLAGRETDPKKVVAEINGEILKPEAFDGRILNAGDEVEIIHFVGGG